MEKQRPISMPKIKSWEEQFDEKIEYLIKPLHKMEGVSLAEDGIPPSLILSNIEFAYLMKELKLLIRNQLSLLAGEIEELRKDIDAKFYKGDGWIKTGLD